MSAPRDPNDASRWNLLRDRIEASDRRVRSAAASTTRPVLDAGSYCYAQSLEYLLASADRVGSAAEGEALLASGTGAQVASERLQRAAVVAVPVLRRAARGMGVPKTAWVLAGSTATSTGLAVRAGLREVQVVGALVAHRIEQATGQAADPALVKKLAVELYLAPARPPDLSNRRLRLDRLMRRWVTRGAVGRGTGADTTKALAAAERLDVHLHVAQWTALAGTSLESDP